MNKFRKESSEILIESLKNRKPSWRSESYRGIPTNPFTKQKYSGINLLLLDTIGELQLCRTKYWATFNQWRKLKLNVEKGATASYAYRCVQVNGSPHRVLQPYPVFHADQVWGPSFHYFINIKTETPQPDYNKVEEIIKNTMAKIVIKETLIPHYDHTVDSVIMPERSIFSNDAQYYATILHELVHWTESRLNWFGESHERELVAEIATGYLEKELELPHDKDMTNHDKFANIWIDNIHKNYMYLFRAAAQATKAVDYLLGFSFQNSRETLGDDEHV